MYASRISSPSTSRSHRSLRSCNYTYAILDIRWTSSPRLQKDRWTCGLRFSQEFAYRKEQESVCALASSPVLSLGSSIPSLLCSMLSASSYQSSVKKGAPTTASSCNLNAGTKQARGIWWEEGKKNQGKKRGRGIGWLMRFMTWRLQVWILSSPNHVRYLYESRSPRSKNLWSNHMSNK